MGATPSASYSVTLRIEYPNRTGSLGKVLTAIGEAGGDVGAVDIVRQGERSIRDVTVNARDSDHGQQLAVAIDALDDVQVLNSSDRTFLAHAGGKIEVKPKMSVKTRDALSMAYTPGVARVCQAIANDNKQAFNLTVKRNTIAVVSDGTAVVVLAALHNALRLVGKELEDLKVVVNGVGASGSACTKILLSDGIKNIIGLDSKGVVHPEREDLSPMERWVAENTNPEGLTGELSDVIEGADLFLGLSVPGVLTTEHLDLMARDPIVFALANPDPEITPEEAEGRARIMATGRSDYPNQINNTLCFPGIFRGALDSRARKMNEEMKLAAAHALAEVIPEEDLSEDYVIPSLFDERIVPTMAEAVAEAARESGSARTSLEQENPLGDPSRA